MGSESDSAAPAGSGLPGPEPGATLLAGILPSLSLLSAAIGLAGATTLPGRAVLSLDQGSGGHGRWLYLGGGLLTDVALLGPIVALFLLFLVWAADRRLVFNAGCAVLLVLLGLSWLAHNGAMEFRLQRGIFPGPLDAREGLVHKDFVLGELPVLLGGRFLSANLVAVPLLGALFLWTRRRVLAMARRRAHRPGLLVGLGLGLFAGLSLGAGRANALCINLHNPGAISSPARTLLSGWLSPGSYDGSPVDVRRLVAGAPAAPGDIAEGARNTGFEPEVAGRVMASEAGADCSRHPLSRPLGQGGTELLEAARAVSRELFRGRTEPPVVFHVSLESVRADDIHSIRPAAALEVAPFLSEVYGGVASAVAFRHAHQSGIRTAQALSGVLCGVGVLPFHLALGRDLGNVPLRCLPDVLADAGFRTRAFYGHELVFDDMGTFLHFHGVGTHERRDFSPSAPRGVWSGVSDASVYKAAADAAAGERGAQYNFVLTLSHHTPYASPSDLEPAQRVAIDEVCRRHDLSGQNCDRLRTLRYADDSLRRFVARVDASPEASRTIVVFAADHTTHEWEPWEPTHDRPEAITQVPLVIWVPLAFQRAASDPALFAAAWSRLGAAAASLSISNSDLPTLLLGLLEESAELRALPPEARWHTLGSQATSLSFRSPTGQGTVFGIDAHAQLFDVSERGKTRSTGVVMDSLRGPDDVAHASPINRPALTFWASFLRGYGASCASARSIRKTP